MEKKIAPMMMSRGCPFKCHFCASKVTFGTNVTYRSKENVIEEIRWLRKNFGVDLIMYFDDTFTLHRKKVLEVCHAMKREKVNWTCNIRVDCVDEELLQIMSESGCVLVLVGVESGNDSVLGQIEKRQTTEQINNCFRLLNKYNIDSIASFYYWS